MVPCFEDVQMEYRRVFDTIPEQFDRYRPRYCPELFGCLISRTGMGPGTEVLEIGPGTGQATDPVLATGCSYLAIELGENLTAKMIEKYGDLPNFSIINDDFITHDFEGAVFDVILSAAAIQWIPEETAFRRAFSLLKPGGTLAMMMLQKGDYRTPNEELYAKIQKLYDKYYSRYSAPYRDMKPPFCYEHVSDYGFCEPEMYDFHSQRVMSADEYVSYCGTHSDHIIIPEPYRTEFFEGLRSAVLDAGDRVVFLDTFRLYLAQKPA